MTMMREKGVALWRQIAAALSHDIAGGAHESGARLPAEAALAARFGLNRHTIRRALEELEAARRAARGIWRGALSGAARAAGF